MVADLRSWYSRRLWRALLGRGLVLVGLLAACTLPPVAPRPSPGPSTPPLLTPSSAPGPSVTAVHKLTRDEIYAIPTAFPTELVPPVTRRLRPLAAGLQRHNMIAAVGEIVSVLISLDDRAGVPVVVEECGESRASYSPGLRRIQICYEHIERANAFAGRALDAVDAGTTAMLAFTTLHEIAHALVHRLDLRLTGNSEDRADQFALLVLTNLEDTTLARELAAAPAQYFRAHERHVTRTADDVHSASGQRARAATCVLATRHPATAVGLDAELRAACRVFTEESLGAWNTALAPYTRMSSGLTFNPQRGASGHGR